MSVFDRYKTRYEASREEVISLQEYLDLCKSDPSVYAGPAERLLMAIGEPEMVTPVSTHGCRGSSRIRC
jgi:serine protein kinase